MSAPIHHAVQNALALVAATDSVPLKRHVARALTPGIPMLPSRQTRGRLFHVDGVDVYTRGEADLMLSDPDETHAWLAAQNAPTLREWR